MTATPCPSCRDPRAPGQYLCRRCWAALPAGTRMALNRRDARAMARLQNLHAQLRAQVPLDQIQVTP